MATAAHAKPHHDYHLVNPSPWPAVGATSAFVAAVGLILWMHGTVAYAPLVMGAGAIGIAYTMVGWWRDVALDEEDRLSREEAGRVIRRSLRMLRPYRGLVVTALTVMVLFTLATLAGPRLIGYGIAHGIRSVAFRMVHVYMPHLPPENAWNLRPGQPARPPGPSVDAALRLIPAA